MADTRVCDFFALRKKSCSLAIMTQKIVSRAETTFSEMSQTDDFVEELFCPICADVYEEPLMLPCTHSFCHECLKERLLKGQVTKKEIGIAFDCPVCRKEVTLDVNGLDSLPSNRLLKRMAEKYKTSRENQNKNDPNTCSVHEKELGAFCGICREPVCIDCIVGDHKGHPIESVEDVYFKRKRTLERRKADLEEELRMLEASKDDEIKYLEELQQHCRKKAESIEVKFDEYIGLIQQSKESVLSELASREQGEVALVTQTIKDIEHKQAELAEALTSLRDSMSRDKITVLKDSKLEFLRSQPSQSDIPMESLRSPRTRCFLDCSLEVDSSSLETAINNAHLVWEPQVDLYSAKHLADRFTQLFDKEWKSAYLESTARNKDEIISTLLHIVMEACHQSEICCETHLEGLTYHMLQPDIDVTVGDYNIHGFSSMPEAADTSSFCLMKEELRKLRAQHTGDFLNDNLIFMIHHELSLSSNSPRQISVYANKCFEVCFMLQIQDPPLHVSLTSDKDLTSETSKDTFRYVKRRGRKTKAVAWPPLYLYKDGPLLAKGVIFVPV